MLCQMKPVGVTAAILVSADLMSEPIIPPIRGLKIRAAGRYCTTKGATVT